MFWLACERRVSSLIVKSVRSRSITVLEDIVLLLDDEIDERTRDPNELAPEALQLKDTADSVRCVNPKLQAAQISLAATDTLQPDLWLTDSD